MAFGDHVQSTSASASGTTTALTLVGVAAGNSIVVASRHGNSTGDFTHLTSVADDVNAGNYTVDVERPGATADALAVAHKSNTGAGNTQITITYGVSGTIRWGVSEREGNFAVDEIASADFVAAGSATTPNVTPDSTDRTVLYSTVQTLNNATDFAAANGETERWEVAAADARIQAQDKIVTSVSADNGSWTWSGSIAGNCAIVAFKAAAGGATIYTRRPFSSPIFNSRVIS
jgi:hypothetical protein